MRPGPRSRARCAGSREPRAEARRARAGSRTGRRPTGADPAPPPKTDTPASSTTGRIFTPARSVRSATAIPSGSRLTASTAAAAKGMRATVGRKSPPQRSRPRTMPPTSACTYGAIGRAEKTGTSLPRRGRPPRPRRGAPALRPLPGRPAGPGRRPASRGPPTGTAVPPCDARESPPTRPSSPARAIGANSTPNRLQEPCDRPAATAGRRDSCRPP